MGRNKIAKLRTEEKTAKINLTNLTQYVSWLHSFMSEGTYDAKCVLVEVKGIQYLHVEREGILHEEILEAILEHHRIAYARSLRGYLPAPEGEQYKCLALGWANFDIGKEEILFSRCNQDYNLPF